MDLGWGGLAAFGYGIASAMIPVLNAEVYAAGIAGASSLSTVWLSLILLSVGTTIGKLVIFESARRGSAMFAGRRARAVRDADAPARTRWGRRIRAAGRALLRWLAHPVRGPLVVLLAAYAGVPPLLLVAALAGASRLNVVLFGSAVLIGRFARFATVAWPVVVATH